MRNKRKEKSKSGVEIESIIRNEMNFVVGLKSGTNKNFVVEK